MPLNEADTCRTYVLPKLYSAGWEDAQISEQKSFTDGRIVIAGSRPIRRPQKRADYILRYRRDFPIAVVEAKAVYRTPGDGLQQAKEYAQILGLKFAYATRVIVPPRSTHPLRIPMVRNHIDIVRELFVADGADASLFSDLSVEQFSHLGR